MSSSHQSAPSRAKKQNNFLPMSRREMDQLGWDDLDILIVTGDAYVDHPAFGAALIGRWLVENGFRAGIIAQPAIDREEDITAMGRPRLFAGITAGAMDSMVAHYTAFRKKRHDDAYTPGGHSGLRPNRAVIVYANAVKRAFKGLPIVIGGVEASMRRAVHYDFWTDSIRRSILLDSKADLLIYGMAERAILETARKLKANEGEEDPASQILRGIKGTVYRAKDENDLPDGVKQKKLSSYEEILKDRKNLMTATLAIEQQVLQGESWLTQTSDKRAVVIAPPADPLSCAEIDKLYSMPFARAPHPSYKESIPAEETTRFSITTHRGCVGGCSFCSLSFHQGRVVQSRSAESILSEVKSMTHDRRWRGRVSDVGGPTANMWGVSCGGDRTKCVRTSCLFPSICGNLKVDQSALIQLLDDVASIKGVRSVRVASGIRHDLALKCPDYISAIVRKYTGGQLKLAPEHFSKGVLKLMRKPDFSAFEKFLDTFGKLSNSRGKKQYIIPYLLSAFPGCTLNDMKDLSGWLAKRGWKPQQVQCFMPTPGTVATAMYCSGIGPDEKEIYVARSDADRLSQHGVLIAELKKREKNLAPRRKERQEKREPRMNTDKHG